MGYWKYIHAGENMHEQLFLIPLPFHSLAPPPPRVLLHLLPIWHGAFLKLIPELLHAQLAAAFNSFCSFVSFIFIFSPLQIANAHKSLWGMMKHKAKTKTSTLMQSHTPFYQDSFLHCFVFHQCTGTLCTLVHTVHWRDSKNGRNWNQQQQRWGSLHNYDTKHTSWASSWCNSYKDNIRKERSLFPYCRWDLPKATYKFIPEMWFKLGSPGSLLTLLASAFVLFCDH